MEKPILSICYPTYKRGDIIYRNVKFLVEHYHNDDIEIVVLDNNSPDNTKELLERIDDSRLHYYKNDSNIGAINLVAILRRARGKFALLVSDEEVIDCGNINYIINVIKKNENIGLIYAGSDVGGYARYVKKGCYKGYDAIDKLLTGTYMSGYIYNVRDVQFELHGTEDADIPSKFGTGYNFLMLAILLAGKNGMICTDRLIGRTAYDGKKDVGTYSYLDKGNNIGRGTYLAQRMDQAKDYIRVLRHVPLSLKERTKLAITIAYHCALTASFSYVYSMNNAFKLEYEDGRKLRWPPVDKDFKVYQTWFDFICKFNKHVFGVGFTNRRLMVSSVLGHPIYNAKKIMITVMMLRRANRMLKEM